MAVYRILQNSTIYLGDLGDKTKEENARRYDGGNKGYLTSTEAFILYANENAGLLAESVEQVLTYLGGRQHPLQMRFLARDEVMGLGWTATDWKGDFHVPNFGAGNVRVGGYRPWMNQAADKSLIILIDYNLIEIDRLEKELFEAILVIGPQGFTPEPDSPQLPEAVERPLILATQNPYWRATRGGSVLEPERKYLAVALSLQDLLALSGGKGLEFYVRLETASGTEWINRDGMPFENFELAQADLVRYSSDS